MKIFLDTANLEDIKEFLPLVQGITTNPVIMAKEGVKQEDRLREICELTDLPISAEVVRADSLEQIKGDALKLADIAPNIVVKIPGNILGLRSLKGSSYKTTVTALMTFEQMALASLLGASYVSIFYCRARDEGLDPLTQIKLAQEFIKNNQLSTQIIVGSLRTEEDVKEAFNSFADIITVPPHLFSAFTHPRTESTIKEFTEKYEKS